MINVLYYHRLQFPSESGQTIQVLRDYHALARQGVSVRLFYRCARPLSLAEERAALEDLGLEPMTGFRLEPLPERRFGKRRLRRAVEAMLGEAPDAILCTRTLEHAGHAIALRNARRRARVLLELHETAIPHLVYREQGRWLKAMLSRFAESRVFRQADALLATVPSQLELLEKLYPGHARAIVLPNGVLDSMLSAPLEPAAEQDGLVHLRYAGHLSAWKDWQLMVQALKHLPQHYVLDVAGGKSPEATRDTLARAAARAGVTGRVNYAGVLAPVQMPRFLAGAHVLLLPLGENVQSRYFTSPMKLFEYAASGVPIVATRQPSVLSLIEEGRHALMVAPGSAIEIARAAQRLIDEPRLAGRLAAHAREWAAQYGYEQRARRFAAFLASLAGTP